MPDEPEAAAAAERGRYALYPHPSGQGLLINRATGLCDRCTGCGCGTQQEQIDLSPGGITRLVGKMGKMGKLKAMVGL